MTNCILFYSKIGPEKGVVHLAVAAVINALWDLWAKMEGKVKKSYFVDTKENILVKNFRPRGYKTFFMLNLAEHEILNAHGYCNRQNQW